MMAFDGIRSCSWKRLAGNRLLSSYYLRLDRERYFNFSEYHICRVTFVREHVRCYFVKFNTIH